MRAISVKLLYHTNHRPTRLKAYAYQCSVSVTRPLDLEMTHDENVVATARELIGKLNWAGTWHRGYVTSREDVFVNTDEDISFKTTAGSP